MAQNPLLEAALGYAARGWPVLPLHSWTGRCSCGDGQCGSPAKHPRTGHGLRDATTEVAVIVAWWTSWPDANVGVRCDQLTVIDIDGPGGVVALQELDIDPDLHPCVSQTGVGRHLLFQGHPDARPKTRVLPEVDVRAGAGSYIVAPPSVHWTGAVYEWKQEGEPPPLPATIRPALGLRDPRATSAPVRDPGPSNGHAPAAPESPLEQLVATLGGVGEGRRHDTALRLCGRMARLGLREDETLAWLRLWAEHCSPPLPDPELRRIVQDIFRSDRAKEGDRVVDDGGGTAAPATPVPLLVQRWAAIDVGAMLRTTPPTQHWLLRHRTKDDRPCPPGQGDGMLECGSTGVLSAAGGSGKSMLFLQLAVSIITGRDWVGFAGTEYRQRGRVCYLAGEDKLESLHRRLLAIVDGLGLNAEEQELLSRELRIVSLAGAPVRLFDLDLAGNLQPASAYADLLQLLGEDGDGKWAAIMLDPAARLCGAKIELDNDLATACVEHLEHLGAEAGGAATLLATHVSKATKLSGQSHARGVTGLGDAARWHLGLVKDCLEFHKANECRPWTSINLRRQGRVFFRGTESDADAPVALTAGMARVVQALRAMGGRAASTNSLAAQVSGNRNQVLGWIAEAASRGMILSMSGKGGARGFVLPVTGSTDSASQPSS